MEKFEHHRVERIDVCPNCGVQMQTVITSEGHIVFVCRWCKAETHLDELIKESEMVVTLASLRGKALEKGCDPKKVDVVYELLRNPRMDEFSGEVRLERMLLRSHAYRALLAMSQGKAIPSFESIATRPDWIEEMSRQADTLVEEISDTESRTSTELTVISEADELPQPGDYTSEEPAPEEELMLTLDISKLTKSQISAIVMLGQKGGLVGSRGAYMDAEAEAHDTFLREAFPEEPEPDTDDLEDTVFSVLLSQAQDEKEDD